MSVYCGDGEPIHVYREESVKARKLHVCDACKETVAPRAVYFRITIIWSEGVETVRRCARCQALHKHLRERCRAEGEDEYPEERLDCGHGYKERWGEEPPPEIAALAFALPGEVQVPR